MNMAVEKSRATAVEPEKTIVVSLSTTLGAAILMPPRRSAIVLAPRRTLYARVRSS